MIFKGRLIANRYLSGFPRRLPISEPVIVRPSVAASKLDAYDYEMDSSHSMTESDFEAGEGYEKDENNDLLASTSKKFFFEFEL